MSVRLFLAIVGASSTDEENIQKAMELLRLDPDAKVVCSPFNDEDPESTTNAAHVVWFSIINS